MRLWLWAFVLPGCFYITEPERQARWDLDGDGVERPEDCDDHDPEVQMRVWCVDADGDGFGDPDRRIEACEAPEGAVADCSDCDDTDHRIHPGAPELCDGLDNNCNGEVDEGLTQGWYLDLDEDGYGDPDQVVESCAPMEGRVLNGLDCDDADPEIHPEAIEVCDGVDNNCDGLVDFEDPSIDPIDYIWHLDRDGDGWGDAERITLCDGTPVDPGALSRVSCTPPPGYGPDGDCDDCDHQVHPDAVEICDGIDNDCDGVTDPGDAEGAVVWYRDADGDGFGDPAQPLQACQQPRIEDGYPFNYVENHQDCDDTCDLIHPLAVEYCNGIDNTCTLVADCPPGCGDCAEPDLPAHCQCVEPTDGEDGICLP